MHRHDLTKSLRCAGCKCNWMAAFGKLAFTKPCMSRISAKLSIMSNIGLNRVSSFEHVRHFGLVPHSAPTFMTILLGNLTRSWKFNSTPSAVVQNVLVYSAGIFRNAISSSCSRQRKNITFPWCCMAKSSMILASWSSQHCRNDSGSSV